MALPDHLWVPFKDALGRPVVDVKTIIFRKRKYRVVCLASTIEQNALRNALINTDSDKRELRAVKIKHNGTYTLTRQF